MFFILFLWLLENYTSMCPLLTFHPIPPAATTISPHPSQSSLPQYFLLKFFSLWNYFTSNRWVCSCSCFTPSGINRVLGRPLMYVLCMFDFKNQVDVQALVHAVELTRQGAVDSLRFSKGDLFLAFQVTKYLSIILFTIFSIYSSYPWISSFFWCRTSY